ncbi:MAG: amidohydrolase family protein [Acidimicrobiales bacterium]|jgi:predicted TIM-barrel fold metal-dependent hydrolase|nr:amidohydrolase family protein [Acidimicrobiales bacterium]MDP6298326.1 amidohydrolase family protein [Acidimicrobiales bacterium]HJM28143.1 amidohydrolase family protein [Acidimicrobiales bacterium]
MLIDTHTHLIGSDKKKFPLTRYPHPGNEWIESSPDADEYLEMMKEVGVSKALLVQPHSAYQTDNSYICSVAAKHSEILPVAIVNHKDVDCKNAIHQLADRGVVGLRLFSIPTPTKPWIGSLETRWLWQEAEKQNLAISICVLPNEIQEIGRCARNYPNQVVVIDHCAFAPIHDMRDSSTQELLTLSKFPNVVLKVTTLVIDDWNNHKGTISDLFPFLAELFGPERLVWGSDFAQTRNRTYQELVDLGLKAMESLGDLSEGPMGLNAKEIWETGKS